MRIEMQRDIEPFGSHEKSGPLGPFDEDEGVLRRFLPTQLAQLFLPRDAIEVGMNDGKTRTVIALHEREGGARYFRAGSASMERISQRANVVLPAPRSPVSVTRSPAWNMAPSSRARCSVAASSGSSSVHVALGRRFVQPALLSVIASWLLISAATIAAAPLAGNVQVSHGSLACGGLDVDDTAMQLHKGPDDRQSETDPVVSGTLRMALEPVEDPLDEFGRYAPAFIAYAEHTSPPRRSAVTVTVWPLREKPMRIGQQVEEHLPDALGIRNHRAEARLRLDVEPDLGFGEPVLNAGDGVGDGLADIDRTEHQFDCARIDRCKVEMSSMIAISAADERMMWPAYSFWRSLSGPTVPSPRSWVKPMTLVSGEPQLVADMMDEALAQLPGALQRLVALRQRLLDVHIGRHIDEGDERRAIRQRRGGAIEHRAIPAFHSDRAAFPDVG